MRNLLSASRASTPWKGLAFLFSGGSMSDTLSAAFDRAKRCESCHFEPCVCVPRTARAPLGEPQTLREAIEKALASESPLKALAVEMEVCNYLRRKTLSLAPKETANAARRIQDLELLEKLLGLK